MDRLASSQFRKTYASLEQPVEVTVNGHVIGRWEPLTYADRATERAMHLIADAGLTAEEAVAGFSTRPFTPVPKVRRRG